VLLASLPEASRPGQPLIELAKALDKHYIPTRYPNGFELGAPTDCYTRNEAARAIEQAEEIVVFGSFAQGRWAPGSDLDVFLVLTSADRPVAERVVEFLPGAFPVGLDLFPFTRDEMAARSPSPLLDAMAASRWRYARRTAAPGG